MSRNAWCYILNNMQNKEVVSKETLEHSYTELGQVGTKLTIDV